MLYQVHQNKMRNGVIVSSTHRDTDTDRRTNKRVGACVSKRHGSDGLKRSLPVVALVTETRTWDRHRMARVEPEIERQWRAIHKPDW